MSISCMSINMQPAVSLRTQLNTKIARRPQAPLFVFGAGAVLRSVVRGWPLYEANPEGPTFLHTYPELRFLFLLLLSIPKRMLASVRCHFFRVLGHFGQPLYNGGQRRLAGRDFTQGKAPIATSTFDVAVPYYAGLPA